MHTPNFITLEKAPQCKRLPEFVPVMKELAEKRKLIFVDNWNYWQQATKAQDVHKNWLDDPIHPNYAGHVEIARLLFKSIEIFDSTAFTCGGK